MQLYWEIQDQTCLYCRCRRMYENTIGKSTTTVSWGSHRCKKGIHSLSHYILVHKFVQMLQASKNGCKGSSGYRMGQLGENSGMAADKKSDTRKRWSLKQWVRVAKFILRHWWIFVNDNSHHDHHNSCLSTVPPVTFTSGSAAAGIGPLGHLRRHARAWRKDLSIEAGSRVSRIALAERSATHLLGTGKFKRRDPMSPLSQKSFEMVIVFLLAVSQLFLVTRLFVSW